MNMLNSTYIIAEMSANHGGDFNRAMEIIHAAKDAGADCIKLQTYTADTLTIDSDESYFKIRNGTWKDEKLYDLYSRAFTPWEWQKDLKNEVEKLGIDFLSTPFDNTAVDFLESIGVQAYKIASFELVDIPLIKYTASKGKPIIMSTGMATFEEIKDAVNVVQEQGIKDLCLLRCSSAYPAVADDMNLRTMLDMKEKFGVEVGLSDHSMGSTAVVTAVGMGAKVIEKHFCLSRKIDTADSSFSMEPEEFRKMVEDIRIAEKAMGKVSYSLSAKEEENRVFRKSIFVVNDIKRGQVFDKSNIRVIRPGYGMLPKYYEEVLGKMASIDIKRGTPLKEDMIK